MLAADSLSQQPHAEESPAQCSIGTSTILSSLLLVLSVYRLTPYVSSAVQGSPAGGFQAEAGSEEGLSEEDLAGYRLAALETVTCSEISSP